MPTSKQILQERLQDAIGKKSAKRSKNPPAAPKGKPSPGKENHKTKATKSAPKKARKGIVIKKAPTIQ